MKMKDYDLMNKQAELLLEDERDYVPALANISALIFESLDRLNWAGFYLMDRGSLLLGPFQGKVACIRIQVGKGVCGTAVYEDRSLVVPDVHEFPGHIACDSASESEIVVPIHWRGHIVGVLDIDSPVKERFGEAEKEGFEELVRIIEKYVDFSRLIL